MTEKIKKIYESAKNNKQFNTNILLADGDTPPNFFSAREEKYFYTMTYYGWLVGKYGEDWRKYI